MGFHLINAIRMEHDVKHNGTSMEHVWNMYGTCVEHEKHARIASRRPQRYHLPFLRAPLTNSFTVPIRLAVSVLA